MTLWVDQMIHPVQNPHFLYYFNVIREFTLTNIPTKSNVLLPRKKIYTHPPVHVPGIWCIVWVLTRKYMHAETLALLTKPLYFPNMKYLK
jgi:hypothetical protein